MIRSINKNTVFLSIRKLLYLNIRAYNKYITQEYLDLKDFVSLLRLSHPLDRESLGFACLRMGLITNEEYKEITKKESPNERSTRIARLKAGYR